MKRFAVILSALLMLVTLSAVSPAEQVLTTSPETGEIPMTITVKTGDHYLQPLTFVMVRRVDSPPQMAFWIEDTDGGFIDTLYVSLKAGTQGWTTLPWEKGEIRREYSVPFWAHRRGVIYPDGLYLPTIDEPLPDVVTGATPTADFTLETKAPSAPRRFVVLAEFNAPCDFNDVYPADNRPGEPGYTGGKWGSGQPAMVYAATVDLDDGVFTYEMVPLGISSPDGSGGGLTRDFSTLTTAPDILKGITITIGPGD